MRYLINYCVPALFWGLCLLAFALLGADRWSLVLIVLLAAGDIGKAFLLRRMLTKLARMQPEEREERLAAWRPKYQKEIRNELQRHNWV